MQPKANAKAPSCRAEGLSAGLERILTVARGLDSNTMQLQYLETLKQVGSSPSTKLVVPMELGGLLNGLRNMLPVDPARYLWVGFFERDGGEERVSGRLADIGFGVSRSGLGSSPTVVGEVTPGLRWFACLSGLRLSPRWSVGTSLSTGPKPDCNLPPSLVTGQGLNVILRLHGQVGSERFVTRFVSGEGRPFGSAGLAWRARQAREGRCRFP